MTDKEKQNAEYWDEYSRYRDFCKPIEQLNFERCCEKYPDTDPEDFPFDEVWKDVPSFEDWKESVHKRMVFYKSMMCIHASVCTDKCTHDCEDYEI